MTHRFNRFTASASHLAICTVIAALVFAAVYFMWYPHEFFNIAGGRHLFFVIVGVDVTLGPLITLVIFKPGKKGLKFDLAVIAAVQFGALLFGIWVLFTSRPVYIVFVKDRFELMRANDYPESELKRAQASPYADFSVTGPKLMGARMPADREERERIMFLGPNGLDLQHMLQHYVPYDAVRKEVVAEGKPVSLLRRLNPAEPGRIDRLVRASGREEMQLRYLPMRAGDHDLAVIVDPANGDVLGIAELNPWE